MKPNNNSEQWREEVSMYVSNTLLIGLRKHNEGAREKE
jgi:hypothetical protein